MADLTLIKNDALRSEFLRAVDLIVQTQVTLFLDRVAPTRAGIIGSLEDRITKQQIGPDDAPEDEAAQVSAMRKLLTESLEIYNDPFANYINPEQLKQYYSRRGGNLMGIGIKFRAFDDQLPVIIGVLSGGPLDGSELQPGDQIVSIDGIEQFGSSSSSISRALKGEAGSKVALQMRHADGRSFAITATRAKVALHYARAEMLENGIGYLKISRFGGNTHETVAELVQELIAKGATGLMLDLRNNPGGSTRAARAIVSMFTDQDNVYCERYKTGATRELPRHGEKLTDLPLVLLVNEKSMSSSEIVAGALQDFGRATLIGAPTYGKGLIQKVFNLKAPLGGAIRTTIAAYATPAHTLIHGVGVTPDIYEETAPRHIFAETGSLNISAAARVFQRELLEARLRTELPDSEAAEMIAMSDKQLSRGLRELNSRL